MAPSTRPPSRSHRALCRSSTRLPFGKRGATWGSRALEKRKIGEGAPGKEVRKPPRKEKGLRSQVRKGGAGQRASLGRSVARGSYAKHARPIGVVRIAVSVRKEQRPSNEKRPRTQPRFHAVHKLRRRRLASRVRLGCL
ncbi:Hypothetical predicted protein [Podarcis lilfordi]|uniref:Uncharacterized protein n=1 Tax=Podarcis lilfordi TaxID=74358 RepID=A0AA35P3N9_9SAUR|nr:Hypothetical predicted protein [Podarcis lilfordi]